MRIEVICTGDEVLTGKVVNTNFSYITQKLEDCGLAVEWETTVGDDRDNLLLAFQLAGQRADAVIVNGGLGPTVDDLSQEIAAKAAGVELKLNEQWLATMEDYFKRRSRVMPPNNIKQAMLPATAEVLDNPVGTACGFAVTIGKARFMFTPGVPRELRRMLEDQIIPRLLAKSGKQSAIYLKRFHSYGIGESHADTLLAGVESLAPEGSVKLGFRSHYPQLETKLTVRGADMEAIRRTLAPVEAEVRKRFGNFIVAENDSTLEGVVLDALKQNNATLTIVETFSSGQIAGRLAHLPGAETILRRGVVARQNEDICAAVGLDRLEDADDFLVVVFEGVPEMFVVGCDHGFRSLRRRVVCYPPCKSATPDTNSSPSVNLPRRSTWRVAAALGPAAHPRCFRCCPPARKHPAPRGGTVAIRSGLSGRWRRNRHPRG